VVLLDEIEKAHPDVFNILLQVLDDGRLTDNKGRTVDFRNTIIIMTSNMGSSVIRDNFEKADGKGDGEVPAEVVEKTRDEVIELMKQALKPEFLNRIDEIVMFTPLTRRDTLKIVDIQIGGIEKMLAHNGIVLKVDRKAREWIAGEGFDPVYGARPVKRAIQQNLVNQLSKEILAGHINREQPVEVSASSGKLSFKN
jgi:ATP-dependent Clp protease ATP-binding subunit ClpB